MKIMPLFSVITVVWNNEKYIENTILNVLGQKNAEIEYIIVDGGSTDHTIDIIKKYRSRISSFISEKDNGIYDAMNKGIKVSTGRFINFMNAGDEFNGVDTCYEISEQLCRYNPDILYGDYIAKSVSMDDEKYVKAKKPEDIWKGMFFCHQSCFMKAEVIKVRPFNLRYKLSSDYNQIVSCIMENKTFFYVPFAVSVVSIDGLSYSNNKTIVEQIKVVYSYRGLSFKLLYYIFPFISNIFKSLLPSKVVNFFRDIKWKYLSTGSMFKCF